MFHSADKKEIKTGNLLKVFSQKQVGRKRTVCGYLLRSILFLP